MNQKGGESSVLSLIDEKGAFQATLFQGASP